MNEDQVAKELADRLPKEQPITDSYPDTSTQQDSNVNSNFTDKLLPEEQLTQMQLLDYFKIGQYNRHDPQVVDYLNTVYEWARGLSGNGELSQLLRVISEQEQHMGISLKDGRLKRLGEYAKISRIRQQLADRERMLYT